MHEPSKEHQRQGCTVVFEKDSHRVSEEAAAAANFAADVGDDEDEESGDNGEVEAGGSAEAVEDLDALLKIDAGDIEAEDVAGEAGYPAEPVARVCDSKDSVEEGGPAVPGQNVRFEDGI